jgi:UDP-N-acetylmuramate: L-alanyl-gamma-D-glutamyl-meso-diaminopimelate ligase
MQQLKKGDHIHLMGICGTAMASLAGILKEQGFKVTGSDQNVYPPMSTFLKEQGIEIMQGYKAENLKSKPDFVVVGNVISKHYEEAQALLESKIPYGSLPETMGEFIIQDRHSIVVAGTHGKTTTTSMAAWVCEREGLKPGFLIGGIAKNFSKSFQNPQGDYFVIEGDEYDTAFFAKVPKFVFYRPRSVILNSVEFDHADIYNSLQDVLKAFESLLDIIPPRNGLLVYNAEDKNIAKILNHYSGKKVSFGFNEGDWSTKHLHFLKDGMGFDVLYKNKKVDQIFVPMFGQYNVINALSVYALAKELDFKLDLKKAFLDFRGVKRRQELIGKPRGIQVIEDFAHHPTAVGSTIESFKKREDSGKLFVIFEPRSNTSRRNFFQKEYTEALIKADVVLISEPFQGSSSLKEEERLDVSKIKEEINQKGQCHIFKDVEEAISIVKKQAHSGDTVVIMSNGGFQGIYDKILKELN